MAESAVEVGQLRLISWDVAGGEPAVETTLGPAPEDRENFERFAFYHWEQIQARGHTAMLITRVRDLQQTKTPAGARPPIPAQIRTGRTGEISPRPESEKLFGVAVDGDRLAYHGYPAGAPRTLYLNLASNAGLVDVTHLARQV